MPLDKVEKDGLGGNTENLSSVNTHKNGLGSQSPPSGVGTCSSCGSNFKKSTAKDTKKRQCNACFKLPY